MNLPPPITSRTNARVKALRVALSGAASRPGELAGLEGMHLLAEAARSGVVFETVFVRQGDEALLASGEIESVMAREFVSLSAEAFASAVDTVSPQGVAATMTIPALHLEAKALREGVTLVLDSLQDPGNVGTLLRSAEAFGVGQVLVTRGTGNVWNPKCMRASAGSVFRVPVQRATLAEIREQLAAAGVPVWAAVAGREGSVAAHEAALGGACALMVGNEGAGLSAEALELAQGRVRIPCAVESLNAAVAGSVLMYEAQRQRTGGAGSR